MNFQLSAFNKMAVRAAREFCEGENLMDERAWLRLRGSALDLLKKLARAQLLGLIVPEIYGGLGSTHLNCVLASEELGRTGSDIFWIFSMINSTAQTMAHWGTEEIKQRYLPVLCSGDAMASNGFTEEGTGSDPGALATTADLLEGEYVINGHKRFIMFGDQPGLGIFYARDLSQIDQPVDTTAFVVDKSAPGYCVTASRKMMGLDGISVADIRFEDLHVPRANVLGSPGKGFGILLHWIAVEKILQSAYMVGLGQAALNEALGHVSKCAAAVMQGIQWMLAEMKVNVEACRLLVQKAAWMMDAGQPYEVLSSEAKLFVIPTIQEVIRMALQIQGEGALVKSSMLERIYRNGMHGGIVATSTEINKSIAGMALIRQHA